MSFEAHITVDPTYEAQLREYCAQHGCKFMCALNSSGSFPRQPMASIKATGIPENEMVRRALDLTLDIERAGLSVSRTKVEELVPRRCNTEEDVEPLEEPQYWEMHIKQPVRHADDAQLLREFDPDIKLSHNVSKHPEPRRYPNEALLTMRFRGVSKDSFMRNIDEVCQLMHGVELPPPVTIHRERVVYDDNLALDSGWLQ